MIDAHLHVVPPRLPGVGNLGKVLTLSADQVAGHLCREMREAGIHSVLAVGCYQNLPDDPVGVNATLEIAHQVPGVHAVGVLDPRPSDPDHLRRVDAVLASGRVKALKAYLGYLPYPPDDPGYRPYYELAERYRLPVILHTGHAHSGYARLRFAHPLLADDVAVAHPQVEFVLSQVGHPWMADAAEVVAKNLNVSVDLSGLVVGEAAQFSDSQRQEGLDDLRMSLSRAFRAARRPNRFIFGSGWPLIPIAPYREFIASAIPEPFHGMVFEENAQRLFRL